MNQDGRRSRRVAEIARSEFARAVLRRIDDPRLRGVMVTNVEASDDLSVIDIGVRFPAAPAEEQPKLVQRLARTLPRLTREIAPRLELRRVPSFRLHHDAGEDRSRRVEELLHEIAVERDKSK